MEDTYSIILTVGSIHLQPTAQSSVVSSLVSFSVQFDCSWSLLEEQGSWHYKAVLSQVYIKWCCHQHNVTLRNCHGCLILHRISLFNITWILNILFSLPHCFTIFIYLSYNIVLFFSIFVSIFYNFISAVGMAMHSSILLMYLTKYYKQPLSIHLILFCTYVI